MPDERGLTINQPRTFQQRLLNRAIRAEEALLAVEAFAAELEATSEPVEADIVALRLRVILGSLPEQVLVRRLQIAGQIGRVSSVQPLPAATFEADAT